MMEFERKFLTPKEVAAIYGIAEKTLANWRSQGKGPAYHKLGGKVRYADSDMEDWVKQSRKLTINCNR
jgi:predicted DNA-binding transcriptional regulator AlpA